MKKKKKRHKIFSNYLNFQLKDTVFFNKNTKPRKPHGLNIRDHLQNLNLSLKLNHIFNKKTEDPAATPKKKIVAGADLNLSQTTIKEESGGDRKLFFFSFQDYLIDDLSDTQLGWKKKKMHGLFSAFKKT